MTKIWNCHLAWTVSASRDAKIQSPLALYQENYCTSTKCKVHLLTLPAKRQSISARCSLTLPQWSRYDLALVLPQWHNLKYWGLCGKYFQTDSWRANKKQFNCVFTPETHKKGKWQPAEEWLPWLQATPWSYQLVSAAFTQPPCVITLSADAYTWMFAFPRVGAHIPSKVGRH